MQLYAGHSHDLRGVQGPAGSVGEPGRFAHPLGEPPGRHPPRLTQQHRGVALVAHGLPLAQDMMRFLFGVAVGALAYWAYEQGMLPFGSHDVFDQVMPGAGSNTDSEIIRPTPAEVSGRPAEPIPSSS